MEPSIENTPDRTFSHKIAVIDSIEPLPLPDTVAAALEYVIHLLALEQIIPYNAIILPQTVVGMSSGICNYWKESHLPRR